MKSDKVKTWIDLIGGVSSLATGGGSFPFAIAACIVGGSNGFWLAVVAFVMLFYSACNIAWSCRKEKIKMEAERANFTSLQNVEEENKALKSDVARLNEWIKQQSVKLTIVPSVVVVGAPPQHLHVTVKVVNEGINAVVIDRVYIDQKTHVTVYPAATPRVQVPEYRFAEPELHRTMRIEPSDMHRFVATVSEYTGIMARRSANGTKRVGTGCVVMANDERHIFEYELPQNFIA